MLCTGEGASGCGKRPALTVTRGHSTVLELLQLLSVGPGPRSSRDMYIGGREQEAEARGECRKIENELPKMLLFSVLSLSDRFRFQGRDGSPASRAHAVYSLSLSVSLSLSFFFLSPGLG